MPSQLVQVTATGLVVGRNPTARVRTSGTATAGGASTLTDSNNTFRNNTVAITSSTDATPIVLLTATHGFQSGDFVTVSGHTTNTAANGTFVINRVDSTHFNLAGSVGSGGGAGASGNAVAGPDCTLVGCPIVITGGTGVGQVRWIATNTSTVLTVAPAWTTQPDSTSTYSIFERAGPVYLKSVSLTETTAGVATVAFADSAVSGAAALLTVTVPSGAQMNTIWKSGDDDRGIPFLVGLFATVTTAATAAVSIEYGFD